MPSSDEIILPPARPSRASARPWPSSDFYMMLLPLPLIPIGPKPRSLRSSRVAQLIDLLIHATIRQRRNKRLTAPHADGKFVPVDLAFLPPRSSRQNSAGGCLDARNRKGGKGSSVILYGVPISASRFGRVWYFVDLDRENQMPDEAPSPMLDRERTTNIVAA